jgi:hypothetical protein
MLNEKNVALLGGIKTSTEVRQTVKLREMSGRDEEIIFDPKLLRNPEKLITELLFQVITDGDLTKEQIHGTFSGDRDLLLLELRKLSYGDEMTITMTCPHCGKESSFIIHLDQVELKPFESTETAFELKKGIEEDGESFKKGTISQPTGATNETFSKSLQKNVAMANAELLAACVKFEELKETTADDIRNLSAKEKNKLLQIMGNCAFGPDMEQSVACASCGEATRLSISLVDLFRPEL